MDFCGSCLDFSGIGDWGCFGVYLVDESSDI